MAWANELLSDMNNVNEVAYDYGHGSLEHTACQRTLNDAAKRPTAAFGSDIAAAANVATRDVMTFANECAHTSVCLNDRARCAQTRFAVAYRRSVHDLDELRADLSND